MVINKRASSKQTGKKRKTGKLPKGRHVYRRDGQPYPVLRENRICQQIGAISD